MRTKNIVQVVVILRCNTISEKHRDVNISYCYIVMLHLKLIQKLQMDLARNVRLCNLYITLTWNTGFDNANIRLGDFLSNSRVTTDRICDAFTKLFRF